MTIDLYYMLGSPPCQSIMLLAKALGLELNLVETDLLAGDNLKPEYIKMNPQHSIPTLNDNGFVITESRAILCYLVNQHAQDESLYPKDPKKRAIINQRLYFDMITLYPSFGNYYTPVLGTGAKPNPAHIDAFKEPFELLDKFLEGEEWVAGSSVTIADISILITISHMLNTGYDVNKHPNISRWFTKAKKTFQGYDEIVTPGVHLLKAAIEASVKEK